jgi:homoaconitase/3-isopropylmalate dehydratase large subunit
LCNMAAEMGAKCASVPFDSITAAHFAKAELSVPADLAVPDTDATYARNYLFALEDVEPMISTPGRVDNVEPVSSLVGTRVDQIFLGTCSNGRYEDLSVAADILRDKKLAPGVRMIVSPASREVLQQALASDVARVLVDAGCSITTPGCGSCAGIHQGVLAEDEVCLATAPRNFVGRMGHKDARIYLASPATVAASALAGQVTDPREVTDN